MTTQGNGDVKSRHDYLPFGEELSINRSASNGYVTDNLRQKFTQKKKEIVNRDWITSLQDITHRRKGGSRVLIHISLSSRRRRGRDQSEASGNTDWLHSSATDLEQVCLHN